MKVIFLIGPYRGESHWQTLRNIEAARNDAAELWMRGYACICPHLNTSFMSGLTAEMTFLEGYHEILRRCDAALVSPYWKRSEGSRAEVNVALANQIPVYFSLEELTEGKSTNVS